MRKRTNDFIYTQKNFFGTELAFPPGWSSEISEIWVPPWSIYPPAFKKCTPPLGKIFPKTFHRKAGGNTLWVIPLHRLLILVKHTTFSHQSRQDLPIWYNNNLEMPTHFTHKVCYDILYCVSVADEGCECNCTPCKGSCPYPGGNAKRQIVVVVGCVCFKKNHLT